MIEKILKKNSLTYPSIFIRVTLAFALVAFSLNPAIGQQIIIPPNYIFYKGDSLKGFDWKTVLDDKEATGLKGPALLRYLYVMERKFIKKKYSLSTNIVSFPFISENHNPLATGCNNSDFEDGNFSNWTGFVGDNNSDATTPLTPEVNGIPPNQGPNDAAETSCNWFTLCTTGTDPYGGFPMLDPGGGTYSCRLGGESANTSCSLSNGSSSPDGTGEEMQQSFTVTSTNTMFTFKYAVCLCDGGHNLTDAPYFNAQVYDASGTAIPCLGYHVSMANVPAGFVKSAKKDPYSGSPVYYLGWTTQSFNLKGYIGQTVTIKFSTASCWVGLHFGYAYVDCTCSQVFPTITTTCNTATLTGPPGDSLYSWSGPGVLPPTNGQSVTVNASGTYTVNVTISKGCTFTLDTIVNIPAPFTINTTSSPTTCTANNGSAGVTSVTGGTPGYTYLWNGGQTTSTLSNLAAGSYTVTVKDANGCTAPATVVVAQNNPPLTPTLTSTDPPCSGATGSASVTGTTGGTPAYTYLWSNGQTTTTITGLAAGSYSVTATDADGCTGTSSVNITIPSAIVASTTSSPTACTATTGTAGVTSVSGGTPGYTYLWSGGQTTSTISGQAAGSYTVTITDANSCTLQKTVVVTTTGATITPTTTSINELCNGGTTGSVSVTGSTGGAAPYAYTWSGGQTTTTVTGLGIGTYTVTSKDNNGCVGTATATITQPTAVAPTATNTAAPCNGANGTASATTTGGTPGYTYSWSSGETTTTISQPAGSYTVTVTDKNGCTNTATTTITQPAAIVITTTVQGAICGANDGGASITNITGGTPAYTYKWSSGQTTSTISNIAAGSYTVIVTDSKNCSNSVTVVVPNTGGPSDSIVSTTNILCFGGNNGSITLGVAGGTPAYSFLWNNGATTQNINGLTAGIYTVTVKDSKGCIVTAADTVKQPSQLRDSIISITNELCFGNSTGTITAGVKGGTPAYTYSWSNGATTLNISNLAAGTYTLTVTDANGCKVTTDTTITQPTLLTLSAGAFPVSCHGECNGQLVSIPKGGTTQYSYLWSNGGTTASLLNVCPGTYSLVVTDANGCKADTTGLLVNQPTAVTGVSSVTTAYCNQADGGACITAGGGTPGYTYAWSNGITTTCISNVFPATYTVIIKDANNCPDTVQAIVPNAPGDTAKIISTTNVTCYGGSDGSSSARGTGGTAPYTYLWSTTPPQTSDSATGLKAGNYTVTITDSKGCSSFTVVTITQPTQVVTTPPAPQTICINQSALLSVTSVGGTPGYTYVWLPGNISGATVIVTPTVTTTYTIQTVDSKSCPGVPVTVVVTVNPPLKVTVTPDKAVCPGGSATMSATASGGDGQYIYTWSPPVGLSCTICQTTVVTPTVTTQYTVTVTDKCGTPAVNDSVLIYVNPVPVVNFKADTLQGCSPLCVNFTDQTTINPSMGFSSWVWTFGDGSTSTKQNPSHCYDSAGVFTVSLKVVSDSGCPDSLTIPNMITVYSHPIAAFTANPQPATIMQPTIYFTDQSTDAYGIKTWFWQFGNPQDSTSGVQNPQFTYADTGTYCPKLTVTNKHGCTDEVEHCIYIAPYFTIYIPNAFSPNGDGLNDYFTAKGTYVCNFEMYIFDRWGMLLYYTEDMNKGWDGRVNGGENIAQEDTYVYLITASDCIDHSKHRFVGRVTIVK